MSFYCLNYRKNTDSINPRVSKTTILAGDKFMPEMHLKQTWIYL